MSNAYIKLYGHKHTLTDDILAIIANAVTGKDDELTELINAFRDQERLDAMEGSPLVALDVLGQLILDSPVQRLGLRAIGQTLIALAKDWTFDPVCVDGMIDELRKACFGLHVWVDLLRRQHYITNADWISDTLIPQLDFIISVLEGHSNECETSACSS